MEIVRNSRARQEPADVPRLGILMLDTRFPRIAGDLGNPETFPFPVLIARIEGATPERVVDRKAEGLLEPFVAGGKALIHAGAAGIATTCGFLSLFQRPLAERLGVPVAASSLLMVPLVERLLPPGRRAGVITFSKSLLTPEHLLAVGAAADTPVEGVPADGVLATVVRRGESELDQQRVAAEVVDAGRRLVAEHPNLGAVVVECTNMPPYTQTLRAALRLPIYDGYDFCCWFFAGLRSSGARWNPCAPSY
ncbi:MAG TPA: aspartate/glutamate racemase family protein [Stellaceae bacterium]|nr:aspartate/glutamate racemase family protein [Stellaceae bacterium]